jgi:Alginate export
MKRFASRLILLSIFFALGVACAQSTVATQDHPLLSFVPTDELNRTLPNWLRFSGEERLRLEGFTGAGFQPDNSDAYLLNRFRFNLGLIPTSWLKFRFQVQDSRVWWKNQKPYAPPYQDTFDLRLAFIEMGDSEKQPVSLRVGRQEINLGDERLVGSSGWTNTARSFDAARLTLREGKYRLDAFASSPVVLQDGNVGDHVPGNNLHGLYGGLQNVVPDATIEPYLLWRLTQRQRTETGTVGNLDFTTVGVRWVGKLPYNFDYASEMASERGSLGTDRIAAWAGHWVTGYTLPVSWTPRWFGEYNYASGDHNGKDGVRQTFDQLFPSGHDKYGLADQVGWRNIMHIRTGIECKPRPKWMLSARYSAYWLADAHDALYNTSGTAVFRRADGSAGRFVGTEFDGSLVYNYSKQCRLVRVLGICSPARS